MEAIDEWDAAGIRKGIARTAVRQLAHRFGPLPEAIIARINALPGPVLEKLPVPILDFKDLEEVENWLAQHASPS